MTYSTELVLTIVLETGGVNHWKPAAQMPAKLV